MDSNTRQPILKKISPFIIFIVAMISLVSIVGIVLEPVIIDYLLFSSGITSYAQAYRLVTYGFIHADFMHLGFNMVWLLIFGSPIVQYYGKYSFLYIFIFGIIAGAIIFLPADNYSLIGASAGVSACIGASLRFILKPAFDFNNNPLIYRLTDGRFLLPSFIFCMADITQALFLSTVAEQISWQSHFIGFVTGALLMEFNFINHYALKRNKLTPSEETYLGD